MGDHQDTTPLDDLDVEGSEAASVSGGRTSQAAFDASQAIAEEIFRLQSEGYILGPCTKEGTVMVNPKTKHQMTVITV